MGYAELIGAGGGREGHEQADEVALAGGIGFVKDGFELLTYGSERDMADPGDLLEGVAGEQAVGYFGLSGGKAVEGTKDAVGEADGEFGVGDEQDEVGVGAGAVGWRERRREQLEGLKACGARKSQGARGAGGPVRGEGGGGVGEELAEGLFEAGLGGKKHAVAEGERGGLPEEGLRCSIAVQDAAGAGEEQRGGSAGVGHGFGAGETLLGDAEDLADLQRPLDMREEELQEAVGVVVHGPLGGGTPDADAFETAKLDGEQDHGAVAAVARGEDIAIDVGGEKASVGEEFFVLSDAGAGIAQGGSAEGIAGSVVVIVGGDIEEPELRAAALGADGEA